MQTRLTRQQEATITESITSGLSYTEAAIKAGCKRATAKTFGRRNALPSPRTALWSRQRYLSCSGDRFCPQCKQTLPLTSFRTYNGRAKYSYCYSCCQQNERQRMTTPSARFARLVSAARNRAESKSVPFTIDSKTIETIWRKQDGRCSYTDVPMTFAPGQRHTVSLDRVVPVSGYVEGNVVLCCNIVNKMKWDMTAEELRIWCQRVVRTTDARL